MAEMRRIKGEKMSTGYRVHPRDVPVAPLYSG